MRDRYSCILPDSSLNSHQKRRKVIKIMTFVHWISLYKMALACNVDVDKSKDKMLISGCNVLPRNVMQTNLGPSWRF